MRRRELLAGLAGGSAGLAGCLGQLRPPPAGDDIELENVTGADGRPSDICERTPKPGRIPAIVDPAFAPNWDGIEPSLSDQETVVGLERAGDARAYPLSVLRLEIVNDHFAEPVLVTYCPLCASGLTAKRTVDGSETIFGNTSYTWQPPAEPGQAAIDDERVFGLGSRGGVDRRADPNLVMFDEATGSYWSQLLGQAICGPLTGETLTLIPSTVTTWDDWRAAHPGTSVLLPRPHSRTMAN